MGIPFLYPVPVAYAAVDVRTKATEMLSAGQTIKANSNYTALFGFGLTANAGEKLTAVNFQINATGGTVSPSDFDGVRLYKDDGVTDDVLDASDTAVATTVPVNIGSPTTIAIAGGVAIPAAAGNYDFIVAIKTNASISQGDNFSFGVPQASAYVMNTGPINDLTGLTATYSLQTDTVAPQAIIATGGPPDGQIGAPVEAMVDRVFDEMLATSSVATSTVLLRTNTGNVLGGPPTGANRCTSVALSVNRIFCNHTALATSTWYTATFTTGITDVAGNPMASNFTSQFQTGSFGGGAGFNPPPFVLGTMPSPGGTLPTNGRIAINFSSNMITCDNCEGSVVNKANVMLHLLSSGVPTSTNLIVEPDTNYLVWNSTNRQLRVIPPASSLTENSYYRLTIQVDNNTNPGDNSCGGVTLPACVMNTDNLAMQGRPYTIDFRAVAADNTPPTIIGSFPDSGAIGVDRVTDDFTISLNEALDPQSVTTSTVKLYCEDSDTNMANGCDGNDSTVDVHDPEVPGTSVVLDSDGRLIHLSPNQILPENSKFIIRIKGDGPAAASGVHDTVGNYNLDHSDIAIRTFTTGTNTNGQATDNTAPTVQFANADNFGIFITLSEAMKFSATANTSQSSSDGVNDVNNLSNWTIETSPNGTNWMAMPLTGKTVRYRSYNRTLEIEGMAMPPQQQFRTTTATSVQDLSSNGLSATNRTAQGTVNSTTNTGGMLGPGATMGPVNYFNMGTSPVSVFPKSPMAGATSRYRVEFQTGSATASSVPVSGKITLAFPTGFSFVDTCATLPTDNFENNDINGPALGTVTIASIACSSISRTVTITLGATGTQTGDMLRFEFQGVVNSTVPKDFSSSGYTVDIKTYNASSVLLETKTSMPLFINAPGQRTISGTVFVDDGAAGLGTANNGIKEAAESGVNGTLNPIKVCLGGPSVGFMCNTIDVNGAYSFTNLNNGFYHLELPPIMTGAYTGGMMSRDVNVSGANATEDFGLQQASANYILTVAVSATGLDGTKLDVMGFSTAGDIAMGPANGPGAGSSVVRECTIGTNCNAVTLPLTQGRWQICVGPWMPKEPGVTAVPDFSFMPPQPVEVAVGATGISPDTYACAGGTRKICFTLTSASNQIKGKVVDGSGNAIPNVFVMARPAFMGTGNPGGAGAGQTDTNGLFNLKTVTGTYMVEASMPGMMSSNGMECTVKDNTAASDNNSTADVYCGGILIVNDISGFTSTPITLSNATNNDLIIKIGKGNTSISGQVLDDSSNPVPYAHVEAMEVDGSGNPLGGWRDSPTDNSGNYTLYVTGGSGSPKNWKVRGFAPGFGELPYITVAVTEGDTLTGKNLQATTAEFGTVTGTVKQGLVGVQGAFVNIHGTTGGNGTVTDDSGAYTLKVRAGSGYTIEGFVPSQGPTNRLTNITIATSVPLTGRDLIMIQPGTIVAYVCKLSSPLTGPTDNGKSCSERKVSGAFVEARDSSGMGNGTGANPTLGQYELYVPAGTYTVKANEPAVGYIGSANAVVTGGGTTYVNIEPPALYSVSGTVTSSTTACIGGATAFLSSATNGRVILAQVASDGAWSVSNIPNGSYSVGAGKPGCVDSASPGTINVSGANLTQAADTDLARTLTAANATISGRAMIGGTNVTFDTMVFASLANGTKVIGMVDTSQATTTNYTLNVTAGTWSAQGRSDGYQSIATSVTVTANGSATSDIILTAIAGYTRKEPMPYSMKPSRGGIVKNPEISNNFEMNIPAGVLGSSSNDGSILTKETTAVSNTSNQTVIGGKGIEVTPKDASGQPITTVSSSAGSSATITIPYTLADVTAAGTTEDKIVIGSWSEEKGQWDPLPTTCDTVNDKCTATVTHFSVFALNAPTSGNAPSTPSGVSASAASSSQITVSWTAVDGATGYDVYRSTSADGTYSRRGSEPTVSSGATTTYADTGLPANTTYYYKVSALNSYGESAASTVASATTQEAPGGGTGGVVLPPTTPTTPPTTPMPPTPPTPPVTPMTIAELKAKIAEILAMINELQTRLLQLQPISGIPAGYKFKIKLKYGQKSDDVMKLQIFLKAQGAEIYPEGLVTGYFGEKTKQAVIKFQMKYKADILAPLGLTEGTGIVGERTMLKINELLGR